MICVVLKFCCIEILFYATFKINYQFNKILLNMNNDYCLLFLFVTFFVCLEIYVIKYKLVKTCRAVYYFIQKTKSTIYMYMINGIWT